MLTSGLAELSAKDDDLERLNTLVDFELFRPALEASGSARGSFEGPPFDHLFTFKILILQAMHALSDQRCEYLIRTGCSLNALPRARLADAILDANTTWAFREAPKRAAAVDVLFARFDTASQGRAPIFPGFTRERPCAPLRAIGSTRSNTI